MGVTGRTDCDHLMTRRLNCKSSRGRSREALVERHAVDGIPSTRIAVLPEEGMRRIKVRHRPRCERMPVGWVERRPARPEIGNIDPHRASALPDAMDLFHRRHNVLEMVENVVEIDGFGAR